MKLFLILLTAAIGLCVTPLGAQTMPPHAAQPDPAPQIELARVANNPNALLLTIRLAKGWHTYWQYPGDAGIAPEFRFTGTRGADVLFPLPQRFDENGLATFGYAQQVSLPILTGNQSLPDIILHLSYAACAQICVPLKATISTRQSPPASAAQFQQAMKSVPRPKPGGTAMLTDQKIRLDLAPYQGRFLFVLPHGMVAEGGAEPSGKAIVPLPDGLSRSALSSHVAEVVVDDPAGPVKLTIALQP